MTQFLRDQASDSEEVVTPLIWTELTCQGILSRWSRVGTVILLSFIRPSSQQIISGPQANGHKRRRKKIGPLARNYRRIPRQDETVDSRNNEEDKNNISWNRMPVTLRLENKTTAWLIILLFLTGL